MSAVQKKDVAVIGAGIAGASAAFALSQQGVDAVLIERDHPASGPTGTSSAVCHLFYTEPELSLLARRGCDLLKAVPEITNHPHPVFHEVGMLWACGANNETVWRESAIRIRDGEGGGIELLSPDDMAPMAPGFAMDQIVLALWEEDYGYADPYDATNAFASAAKAAGVEVKQQARVHDLEIAGGKVTGLSLDNGDRLAVDTVICAMGPWTGPFIEAQTGAALPVHIERHAMAVLDSGSATLDILPFAWCDDINAHYARPERDHSILIGTWAGGGTGVRNDEAERPDSHDDPNNFDNGSSQDESVWIVEQALPRLPALAEFGIKPGYACLYDMSPDDLPVVDHVPGIDGLIVVAGSSGHGFKLGPAIGEEAVRLATTGASDLLAPFSLERFN
ncbi:MAG: FAD-dependent oxidoreductase [Pseudomonadota bacterium]